MVLLLARRVLSHTRSDFFFNKSFLVDCFYGYQLYRLQVSRYTSRPIIITHIRNTIFYHKNMFVITEVII